MYKIKCVLLIATSLLMLVTSCSIGRNYDDAYVTRKDGKYLVQMRGKRRYHAHDPISGINPGTYEDGLVLELPRIEGVVEGSEIPVDPGRLSYGGRVVITNGKMKVDLYYVIDGPKDPLSWNGEYTLVQKNIETKEP